MKQAAREGNTRMDETLLPEQRKARFEQERLNADKYGSPFPFEQSTEKPKAVTTRSSSFT